MGTSTAASAGLGAGVLPHWHAYAKTGRDVDRAGFPYGQLLDGDQWLAKPRDWIAATLHDEVAAERWMKEQLAAYPPANVAAHGYAHATLNTRLFLTREPHRDVWAHYWDRHGREVLRLLAPCPRPIVSWALKKTPVECPETRAQV
ncbi:hypothetical protein ACFY0N_00230 [Streptomyces vinaceus]|uniref:hypothetical protein n=1 Tax=Streptomyces vinaceus TaxID=1960 RepID=UPI0036B4AC02